MERPEHQSPAWWKQALALDLENRLDQAETCIEAAVPTLHSACQIAELYRRRMKRLLALGDRMTAEDAYKKARDFMVFYASLATSGGEGAALSAERDAFLALLAKERAGQD